MDFKCWFADVFIVFARIEDDKNITGFIVEVDLENNIYLATKNKLGIKASSTPSVFNETKVPVKICLQDEEKDLKLQ